MSNWVCYLLKSVDNNKTYIGATNNLYRRLCDHNGIHGISKGAKATKGNQWIVVLFISGFKDRIGCLSFETGAKKQLRKKKGYYRVKGKTIEKRIICYYNLLYLGNKKNKWFSKDLQINWLEKQFYQPRLKLPDKVKEKIGVLNVDLT